MKKAALCLALALATTTSFAADSGDGLREFLAGRAARDAEIARSIWEYAEVGYQETKSTALLQQELTQGRLQGRGRRRRHPDGLRRDRRQRQARDRHPRRVRRAPGHQPGRRPRPQADRGQERRPRLRASPVRHGFRLRRHRARRLAQEERHAGDDPRVRHARRGRRLRQGVHGARRPLQRRGRRAALARLRRELRGRRQGAGQQVREVPLPRPLGARLRRARQGPLGARRRRGDERHGEHDARAHSLGCAHALRHHERRLGAERGAGLRRGLLLRAPHGREDGRVHLRPAGQGLRGRGARHRHDRGPRGHRRHAQPARERGARARDEREAERRSAASPTRPRSRRSPRRSTRR